MHAATVALAVLLAGGVAASRAAPHHGERYGYQLDLPADWTQIPQDAVQSAASAMQRPGVKHPLIYDAGFQPSAHRQPFEYPYVLVQVIPYANFGLSRQVAEEEFAKVVQALTGADMKKVMDAQMSDDARALMVGAPTIGSPQLDRAKRRYLVTSDMTVSGVGRVRGLVAGHFGRECIVQVMYYAPTDDWAKHEATSQSVVDSFRFDPAKAYNEAEATVPGRFNWSAVGQKALGGAVVGGAAGALVYLLRRLKRPRSPERP